MKIILQFFQENYLTTYNFLLSVSLLFAVFINDLPNCVSLSTSNLFADNKCLKVISNPTDIKSLQQE